MNYPPTLEKRQYQRIHLICYLRVFDRDTGAMIGHLVDISPAGLMLVSEAPLAIGKHYKLRMTLPDSLFDTHQIEFNAQSLWSSNDVNPDFYDTGFELGSISQETQAILTDLMREYRFNE